MSPNIDLLIPPDFLSSLDPDQREILIVAVNKAYMNGFIDARKLTELAERAKDSGI